jgi:hypothetical protein
MVVAAANQCRHAATAGISPGAMLGELRTAIALLRFSGLIPPAAAHIEKLKSAGPVVEVRFPIVEKVWTTTTQDLADRILKDSETFTLRRDDGSVAGSSGGCRAPCARSPTICCRWTSRITEGCGILSTRPSAAGPSSKWSKGWERLIDLGKKIQLKSARAIF